MRQIEGTPLWIGHVGDMRDLAHLLRTGIQAAVDLALNESPAHPLTRDLVYLRFPLVDGTGNPDWLLESAISTVAGLLRRDVETLVYCASGLSRSVCIGAVALSIVEGTTASDALSRVAKAGPTDVAPVLWNEVSSVGQKGDTATSVPT